MSRIPEPLGFADAQVMAMELRTAVPTTLGAVKEGPQRRDSLDKGEKSLSDALTYQRAFGRQSKEWKVRQHGV
jgi:hypothetical protein